MTARLEQWVRGQDGRLYRPGRAPRGVWAGVDRELTLITTANSGYLRACLEDDRDPEEPLTTYTGPNAGGLLLVTGNGEEFPYYDMGTTRIALQGADQRVRGCKFNNSRTWGGEISQVDCGGQNTLRARIECNTIVNNFSTHHAANAFGGHDYTAIGNYVSGYVDGFGIWNTFLAGDGGGAVNVKVYENLFDYLAYYWASTTGVVHPTDNESHAEGGQIHNGSLWEVIGNTFHIRFRTDIGDQTHRSVGFGHALTMTFAAGVAHTWKVNGNATFSYDSDVPFNFGSGPAAGFEGGNEMLRNRFSLPARVDPDAEIYLDALWQGQFGVGVPADVNAFMDMADPNKSRNSSQPVSLRRNV